MGKLKTFRHSLPMHKPQLATRTTSTERTRGGNWQRIRERILMRDAGLCQEFLRAGETTAAAQVDHITTLEAGGTDADSNLQSLCVKCHDEKTKREAQERAQRGMHPTP